MPHKIAASRLWTSFEPNAREIGAINTVARAEQKIMATTPTGPDSFGPFARNSPSICAICASFCSERVAERVARSPTMRLRKLRATCSRQSHVRQSEALATELAGFFTGPRVLGPVARLEAVPWEEQAFAIPARTHRSRRQRIVARTEADRSARAFQRCLAPHLMVYDLIYKPERTPLLVAVRRSGARGANGLSMLATSGSALRLKSGFSASRQST